MNQRGPIRTAQVSGRPGESARFPTGPWVPLFVTREQPCPYLAGRQERKVLTLMQGPDAAGIYARLSKAGFRRSHQLVYRPACSGCDACKSVRVVAGSFRPSRNLKRVAAANRDLRASLCPAEATEEHFRLFRRYLSARHGDGEMADMTWFDYREMVEETPVDSALAEFRDSDGRLLAVLLHDWLADGGSAVYSFFEPSEDARSLGTFMILWLIEESARRGLPYCYLGYWIAGAPKMDYKRRFRPLEVFERGHWQRLSD